MHYRIPSVFPSVKLGNARAKMKYTLQLFQRWRVQKLKKKIKIEYLKKR